MYFVLVLVVYDTSLRELKIQKHRSFKKTKKVELKFGEYAFVAANESRMELIHFTFFKRYLKKLIKKKKKNKNQEKEILKNYKIWVFLLPNYILSKKSKNSRMGKGKGGFLRWIFRIQRGLIISEFLGISYYRLKKIIIHLKKKLKLKISLVRNENTKNTFTSWSRLNNTLVYFNKYRYM